MSHSDRTRGHKLSSRVIASQIKPIEGWSKVQPSRPKITIHKIARDSGYATIAVNKEVELLMGVYDYKTYEFADEILRDYSNEELKKRFIEVGNRDKRANTKIDSIYTGKIGDISTLIVVHDFHMKNSGIIGRVKYHYIIGAKGWISIGCGFKKEEEYLYVQEYEQILKL